MDHKPVLGIIVPCYNEEEIIAQNIEILHNFLDLQIRGNILSLDSFIGIIDDHSRDRSWAIIKKIAAENDKVKAIRLSANKGHQYALLAGLYEFYQSSDCLVSLDADLQDDIDVIPDMVEKFSQGNEIVYGVRSERMHDSNFKRVTAVAFYKLLNMLGVNVLFNHADFRLTGKRANEELKNFQEVNLFLRGIFPLMGFNTAVVYYDRKERQGGKTKYPLRKMISLALDGITSFSVVPLRIITFIGFIVFIICLALMVYALLAYLNGRAVAGWFSTVLPFYFLGGIQILCIGILGEYLGKIYKEVKSRPRFIIEERI
ncbi:MAG: glycosyltransferase family 2 protein [Bacteroidales bacterium]|nr:glycosyltransferase family 2 protein [Bacteroidales bacterium]